MTSKRNDKDFVGAGVNISLAIAGVVAAGVGLATMSTAFKPLPKPGVPVVISTAAPPAATVAAWRHAEAAKPHAQPVSEREAVSPPVRAHHAAAIRHRVARHPTLAKAERPIRAVPVKAPAPVAAPKPAVQQVAKADVPEKLCKAPSPQVLSAKSLQPAMILRYDAKFKAPAIDISPAKPPAQDDEERRLKLSALLANMLDN